MITTLDTQKQASLLLSIFSLVTKVSKKLNREVTGEQIFEMYKQKDEQVFEIIDSWINGIVLFAFNLIWTIDPE